MMNQTSPARSSKSMYSFTGSCSAQTKRHLCRALPRKLPASHVVMQLMSVPTSLSTHLLESLMLRRPLPLAPTRTATALLNPTAPQLYRQKTAAEIAPFKPNCPAAHRMHTSKLKKLLEGSLRPMYGLRKCPCMCMATIHRGNARNVRLPHDGN